ncbi:hypothetical protein BJX62DRAFT_241008 [Aspergillus germanicus]
MTNLLATSTSRSYSVNPAPVSAYVSEPGHPSEALPSPPSPKQAISSAPPTTPFLGGAWGRLCRPQNCSVQERAGPPLVGSGLGGLGVWDAWRNATALVSQPPLGDPVLESRPVERAGTLGMDESAEDGEDLAVARGLGAGSEIASSANKAHTRDFGR